MPRIIAVIKHGGGCDYTVACGTDVVEYEESKHASISEFIQEQQEMVNFWGGRVKFYQIEKELKPVEKKVVTEFGFEPLG